jgi:hypothetical protein
LYRIPLRCALLGVTVDVVLQGVCPQQKYRTAVSEFCQSISLEHFLSVVNVWTFWLIFTVHSGRVILRKFVHIFDVLILTEYISSGSPYKIITNVNTLQPLLLASGSAG